MVHDIKKLHTDLTHAISQFIKRQEERLVINNESDSDFMHYFTNPEHYALHRNVDIEAFLDYRRLFMNTSPWIVNIISFNYSSTIESLLKLQEGGKNIGAYFESGHGKTNINRIEHIHGYTEDRLVVGVNDDSQVENKRIHSTSAMNYLVKSRSNDEFGEGHEKTCKSWIKGADLICLFGVSFGKTDKRWWADVVDAMINTGVRLIVFYYEPNKIFSNLERIQKQEYISEIKKKFLDASGEKLEESIIKNLEKRIFIGHNTGIFKVKIPE